MQPEFKKTVLKQIDRTMNEFDKLLKIEGTLTDLTDLPAGFSTRASAMMEELVLYRERIEDESRLPIGRRPPSPRLGYGGSGGVGGVGRLPED